MYPKSFIKSYGLPHIHAQQLPSANELVKKQTKEYGIGIYAMRPYMRGECIGHFIAKPTRKLLQHSLQRDTNDHLEDPYFVGYLMHSCDPNVVVDMHQQKVFCVKDITVNQPLCMDYAITEDQLFKQFACACGAPNCRGWIAGRNEPVNDIGVAFLNGLTSENTNFTSFNYLGSDIPKEYHSMNSSSL